MTKNGFRIDYFPVDLVIGRSITVRLAASQRTSEAENAGANGRISVLNPDNQNDLIGLKTSRKSTQTAIVTCSNRQLY